MGRIQFCLLLLIEVSTASTKTYPGAVRLIDYGSSGYKRIQVFKQNSKNKWKWGSLCGKCWTSNNSNVVCSQYRLRSSKVKINETEVNTTNPTIWKHVQFNCSGNEEHLSDCPSIDQECKNCGNDEVIINCNPEGSGLGENCTLNMNASCENTSECKEDDGCRKTNKDVPNDPFLLLIFGGVSIAVLFIILAVVVFWCKKKRRNCCKCGKAIPAPYHHRQPLDYSEPVLNLSHENVNENKASEDGLYSLVQSNVSVQVPGPTTRTRMTETDNSVLVGRRVENDVDGLYSHSKLWTNTGEYDVFVRKDSETDVNNLYDHARGIQQNVN